MVYFSAVFMVTEHRKIETLFKDMTSIVIFISYLCYKYNLSSFNI